VACHLAGQLSEMVYGTNKHDADIYGEMVEYADISTGI